MHYSISLQGLIPYVILYAIFLKLIVVSRCNALMNFFHTIKTNLAKRIKSTQHTSPFLPKELRKFDFLIAWRDTYERG